MVLLEIPLMRLKPISVSGFQIRSNLVAQRSLKSSKWQTDIQQFARCSVVED